MDKKRILVTGADGFIGGNIVKAINAVPHWWEQVNSPEQKPEILLHQAANNDTLDMDRDSMFRTNVEESKTLFNKCLEGGCRQFVFASSTAVYGDQPPPHSEATPVKPLNPYAESKAVFEFWATEWAKEKGVNLVSLRYCNVYGPGEEHKGRRASMIYQLFKQMMVGKRPRLFKNGEQKRDWIWVTDVVHANLQASRFQGVEIVNCGLGNPVTFNFLIAEINRVMGTSLEPEYIDNPAKSCYQNHTECDMSKANSVLDFRPAIGVPNGISCYWDYLKKF
jgi:ADP-L-glycero-D-manno-heptose 6-epimerase